VETHDRVERALPWSARRLCFPRRRAVSEWGRRWTFRRRPPHSRRRS
jgi:hypothetical protein